METRKETILELDDASPALVFITILHILYILFQRVIIRLGRAVTLRERTGAMPLFMTLFLGAAIASALIIANPQKMPVVAVIYINLIFLTLVALGIAIKFRASRHLPDSFLYHLFTFQVYAIIGAGIASSLFAQSLVASLAVIFGYASSMVCLVAASAHLGAGVIRSLTLKKNIL
jgi:hypothetical protein